MSLSNVGSFEKIEFQPDFLQSLRNNNWRIHLCCFKSRSNDNHSFKHEWPTGCSLRINNEHVTLNKYDEKNPFNCLPADITVYCKPGSNTIHIETIDTGFYHVILKLMSKVNIVDMIEQIKQHSTVAYDDAIEQVKKIFKQKNTDVEATSLKVSLLDPLKQTRITIPGRASTCKHVQVFDIEGYLMLNERIRKWKCPVCNQTALFETLQYDCYFARI
jgi:hypothetical protein